jgi:hypothetical protein
MGDQSSSFCSPPRRRSPDDRYYRGGDRSDRYRRSPPRRTCAPFAFLTVPALFQHSSYLHLRTKRWFVGACYCAHPHCLLLMFARCAHAQFAALQAFAPALSLTHALPLAVSLPLSDPAPPRVLPSPPQRHSAAPSQRDSAAPPQPNAPPSQRHAGWPLPVSQLQPEPLSQLLSPAVAPRPLTPASRAQCRPAGPAGSQRPRLAAPWPTGKGVAAARGPARASACGRQGW